MENENEHLHKKSVHKVLAHSYLVYFILMVVGVCLDLVFNYKTFSNSIMVPIGILLSDTSFHFNTLGAENWA